MIQQNYGERTVRWAPGSLAEGCQRGSQLPEPDSKWVHIQIRSVSITQKRGWLADLGSGLSRTQWAPLHERP